MTEPTPPTTPSTSMARNGPSGRVVLMSSPSQSKPISIQSMGYWPSVNVASNISQSSSRKMGNPSHRWVMMRSSTWVTR